MKITRNEIPRITIEEFADQHGLEMEINERKLPLDDPARFYAQFKRAEVKDGGCLVGVYGNGSTQEEAIRNYAPKIALKILVIDACSKDRREIEVPRLSVANDLSSATGAERKGGS